VFGRRAGQAATAHSEALQAQLRARGPIQAAHDELDSLIREGDELARPLQRAIRNAMWESCGVVRNQERLALVLEKLAELKAAAESVDVRPSAEGYKDLALALDLRGSLVAAEATIRSAIKRRESRGAHQRDDYPGLDPQLQANILVKLDEQGNQVVDKVPVPPVSDELRAWVGGQEDLQIEGRLLE
jgi:succinate dehydrogenase / fumarate reductase flavoprotein subunit